MSPGSGSRSGAKPMDKRIHKYIKSQITRGISDATHVMFGTIKEEIMELLNERLRDFRPKITAGQLGDRTLSHRVSKDCGSPKLFVEEDPIAIPYSEGSKVRYASCLRGDRFCNWNATEVSRTLQEELNIIIGHISDRLVTKFEGHISVV